MFDILINSLDNCTDFRYENRVNYSLSEIVFLCFCGVLCGCENYEEIEDLGGIRLDWLRKYLPYANGIPSHDTINRAMCLLSINELSNILKEMTAEYTPLNEGEVLHIDGKSLSGSVTKKEVQTKKSQGGKRPLHTLNVFSSILKSCIFTQSTESKGSEKAVLEELLELLDLENCLLTLDANFCVQDLIKKLRAKNSDYLIGLKKNQLKLYESAEGLLSTPEIITSEYTSEPQKGHGRIDKRTCKVLIINELNDELKQEHAKIFSRFKDIKTLIRVDSERTIIATGKTTQETRYYLSSKDGNALYFSELIRSHWSIENQLHWMLDTAFGEDKCKIRNKNAAFAFSIFRKIVLNILNNFDDPKTSTKRKLKKCAMSEAYLEKVVLNFAKDAFS